MADKDKFADEVMSDEELDGVAGGTLTETNDIIMAVGKVVEHNGFYNNKPAKFMWYLDDSQVAGYLKKITISMPNLAAIGHLVLPAIP